MKLEKIGFYTLHDERAKNVTNFSSLQRCELILTDRCNFKCSYCRGLKPFLKGDISFSDAIKVIDIWTDNNLQNIRFSGGEPTVWKGLVELVKYTKSRGVSRIALSTNGSASIQLYKELIDAGVDDFSISLDACCAESGDKMAGGKAGMFNIVSRNFKFIAQHAYVTAGVVLTEENSSEANSIIEFAHDLGAADIRIISSAQRGRKNDGLTNVKKEILDSHPILKYRAQNMSCGRGVRGLSESDSHYCPLVLDDMAVAKGFHFPCIIYLREYGLPIIGEIGNDVRDQRLNWFLKNDTHKNKICRENCLDVCVDYNNRAMSTNSYLKKLIS